MKTLSKILLVLGAGIFLASSINLVSKKENSKDFLKDLGIYGVSIGAFYGILGLAERYNKNNTINYNETK